MVQVVGEAKGAQEQEPSNAANGSDGILCHSIACVKILISGVGCAVAMRLSRLGSPTNLLTVASWWSGPMHHLAPVPPRHVLAAAPATCCSAALAV